MPPDYCHGSMSHEVLFQAGTILFPVELLVEITSSRHSLQLQTNRQDPLTGNDHSLLGQTDTHTNGRTLPSTLSPLRSIINNDCYLIAENTCN